MNKIIDWAGTAIVVFLLIIAILLLVYATKSLISHIKKEIENKTCTKRGLARCVRHETEMQKGLSGGEFMYKRPVWVYIHSKYGQTEIKDKAYFEGNYAPPIDSEMYVFYDPEDANHVYFNGSQLTPPLLLIHMITIGACLLAIDVIITRVFII